MKSSTGRAVAGLLIVVDIGALMWTIILGFHIEPTTAAVAVGLLVTAGIVATVTA